MRFGALDFTGGETEQPIAGAVFVRPIRREELLELLRSVANSVLTDSGRDSTPAPQRSIQEAADRFFPLVKDLLPNILGREPTQGLFRYVTFSISNVVLQLAGQGQLQINEFMAAYARMFLDGQLRFPRLLGRRAPAAGGPDARGRLREHELDGS